MMPNNSRHSPRYTSSLPIQISFGSQITLSGQIKDLSLKSAFIYLKSSIHMALNDELTFSIANTKGEFDGAVQGKARISRIAAGEGIAIYFTNIEESCLNNLTQLISTL